VFNGEVNFIDSTFEEDINFCKSIFKGNVHFQKNKSNDNLIIKGNVNFSNSTFENNIYLIGSIEFKGKVDFNSSTFKRCTYFEELIFTKNTYFNDSIFEGKVDFKNTVFKDFISFDKSIFNEPVKFGCISLKCNFESLVSFEKTEFNYSVNFWNTKFSDAIFKMAKFNNTSFISSEFYTGTEFLGCEFKNMDFYGVKFKSVSFEYCKCNGYFRFSNEHPNIKMDNMEMVFNGDLYIKYCSFEGMVIFNKTKCNKKTEIISNKFNHVEFLEAEFNKTKFENNIFNGDISFEKITFKKNINLLRCKFNRNVLFLEVEFNGENIKFENLKFYGITEFSGINFNKNVEYIGCDFEEDGSVKFINVNFNNSSTFLRNNFKSNVEFVEVEFNNSTFEHLTFKSVVRFIDISCMLFFFKCIFENVLWIEKNKDHINEEVIIFCDNIFKEPKCVKFENLLLSKTSFLRTDVRDIIVIEKSEKILDDYLLELINKKIKIDDNNEKKADEVIKEIKELSNNKDEHDKRKQLLKKLISQIKKDNFICFTNEHSYENFVMMLCEILPYLEEKTVLKEYADLRKSFENNRTYAEASKLFVYEMDLLKKGFDEELKHIKRNSKILQKIDSAVSKLFKVIYLILGKIKQMIDSNVTIKEIINLAKYLVILSEKCSFWFYYILSDYGESITRPAIISIAFIFLFPLAALYFNYFNFSKVCVFYFESLLETLRAFFQLGIKDTTSLMYYYEWFIRTVSLILIGNILIAIKRRLERK
jgi:uncharacterized protein YjbI with pentapeptide repeats